jgi:gliding motility-associated-like protein
MLFYSVRLIPFCTLRTGTPEKDFQSFVENVCLRHMKSSVLVMVLFLLAFCANAQNRRPKIIGQVELTTYEEQPITVLMSDLKVEDRDDWFYPFGFTMALYPGANYSINGDVVTPAADYSGELMVEVTVNDGQDNSNKFSLRISVNPVNDRPVIVGSEALSVDEGGSLIIPLNALHVTDPDDKYPDDFILNVYPGNNYSVNGTTVKPAPGFAGTLSVVLTVNDGDIESEQFAVSVEVKPIKRVPEITGQANLALNEDESITLKLSDLTVKDDDSAYPNGFTLTASPGQNYSVANGVIRPSPDFYGKLTVPVTVNDGTNTSKPFDLVITVVPVDDAPRIIDLESVPLVYSPVDGSEAISETISVEEVDGDNIVFAEVGIRPETYQVNVDKLLFVSPASAKIRGSFDPNTGVLTLVGEASPSFYDDALRAISYEGIGSGSARKIVYFRVNDGKTDSETVERVIMQGDAPVALDIPTGFTPNGDHANDTWKIIPLKSEEEFLQARVKVYNKAGILVYESVGLAGEWDGRLNGQLLPSDIYFYTIDLNLNTPAGYIKGMVTILR